MTSRSAAKKTARTTAQAVNTRPRYRAATGTERFVHNHRGKPVSITRPLPQTIDFRALAHAMACATRYAGNAEKPYFLGQHVLLVKDIAETLLPSDLMDEESRRQVQLYALLHDSHETFTSDIPNPTKQEMTALVGWDVVGLLEDRLDAVIFLAAGLNPTMPPAISNVVKTADMIAYATEVRDLFPENAAADMTKTLPPHIKPARWHVSPRPWPDIEDAVTAAMVSLMGVLDPATGRPVDRRRLMDDLSGLDNPDEANAFRREI